MPVGIVVERRDTDHPWQSHSWHAVAVIPGAPPVTKWGLLTEGPGWGHYHAATLTIELHRRETEGYRYNLSAEVPSVYVVLRREEEAERELVPFLATVSPYEAQDYLDASDEIDEIIDRLPMPDVMIAWVQDFVKKHHVDKPFRKRKRERHESERREGPIAARADRRGHGRP